MPPPAPFHLLAINCSVYLLLLLRSVVWWSGRGGDFDAQNVPDSGKKSRVVVRCDSTSLVITRRTGKNGMKGSVTNLVGTLLGKE